ncbi:transmembrane protein 53-like [Branchiostoma floridae x Branchiostoma japonicum]
MHTLFIPTQHACPESCTARNIVTVRHKIASIAVYVRSLTSHSLRKMLLGRILPKTREALQEVPGLSLVRFCSSQTKVIRVSSNLELRTRHNATDDDRTSTKPLVLLYTWFAAKRKHKQKIENIHLDRGFDVMTISLQPLQLMFPQTGAQVIAEKVVDFVHQPQNARRPLLVHAFSAGGYMYSETLLKSLETSEGSMMKDRIRGQIFDSLVDFYGIPDSVSTAMFKNPLLRTIMRTMIKTYMTALYKPVTSNYIRASEMLHSRPVRSPALFLYSKLDPAFASNERLAKAFVKKEGISVYYKCWDDSPHVQHMYKHPIEYVEIMDSFLSHLPPFAGKEDRAVRDNGKLNAFTARQKHE